MTDMFRMGGVQRPSRRPTLAGVGVVAAVAALAASFLVAAMGHASGVGRTGVVRTLLDIRGPIHGFAQDGARIAWVNRRGQIFLRNADGGKSMRIGSVDLELGDHALTLAGDRTVFWYVEGGNAMEFTTVYIGSPANPGGKELGTWQTWDGTDFDHQVTMNMVGPSGDGPDLLLGWTTRTSGGRSTGFVERIDGVHETRLNGIGPAALLDVDAGRAAVAPAVPAHTGSVVARPVVEIRDARSGARIRTIRLGGTPTSIAVSDRIVAAFVPGTTPRIERYAIATGRKLGNTGLPTTHIARLDASLDRVVLQSKNTIWVVDGRGRLERFAHTDGSIVGVSVEGRRIAWGENLGKRAYVRAVTLG